MHSRFQTSYPPSAHFIFSPSAPSPPSLVLGCSSMKCWRSSSRSTELLHFFCSILSTLSVFRNPILTHLLSGFLDSLLCVLIAPSPGLAFSLVMRTHASGGVVIFVRQSLSFSELSSSFLSSPDPYSGYVGVSISLNNSSSLSFLNVYASPIRSSPMDGRTDSFCPSFLPFSRDLFYLGDFNCHHPLWDSRGTYDPHEEEVFDWVISSDLLPLNDPDTPTLLHRSSPDISFAPSFLALSYSWEMLQDLGSDHLPIVLSVCLSLSLSPRSFAPTSISLPSIFRKLTGMTLHFTLTFTVLLQRNTRLFPLLLLSTSLAFNATNLPFLPAASNALRKPGGLLKWKKQLVKDATLSLTQVMKNARLTSPLPDELCQSSPRPRLRHGRRLVFLFHPNIALNLYTLLFALSLALLSYLSLLLISPTVLLPGSRLQSTPFT